MSLGAYRCLRGYNTTHHNPKQYFDDIHGVPLSELQLCSETDMSNPQRIGDYARFSGDYDGVVQQPDGSYFAKCDSNNDKWWYAPACRHNVSECIPLFTSGNGWKLQALMQWSTAYGIPSAIGLSLGWSTYVKHVSNFRALFYWWIPDSTFVDMLPSQLVLARHSANEWLMGDKKSGGAGSYVAKMVSRNLQSKAGRVRELLGQLLVFFFLRFESFLLCFLRILIVTWALACAFHRKTWARKVCVQHQLWATRNARSPFGVQEVRVKLQCLMQLDSQQPSQARLRVEERKKIIIDPYISKWIGSKPHC